MIVCFFGAAMLLPAILDLADDNDDYRVFLTCSAITMFGGLSLVLGFRQPRYAMGVREIMLSVPVTWIVVSRSPRCHSCSPASDLSYTDAVFETMSGIAAVGSTVMSDLDEAPLGILLWRWLLVWLGGFGIITLAVLVLPFLRVGGMQLFVLDLSAQTGKFVPRMPDLVVKIGLVYVGLTRARRHRLPLEGMGAFDALGHAMAAVATGGFSSHDEGIGLLPQPGHRVDGDVIDVAVGDAVRAASASASPRAGCAVAGRAGAAVPVDHRERIASLFVWRIVWNEAPMLDAIREAAFNVLSTISTTGFTSPHQDHAQWGGFPAALLLTIMLVGGCTGSTAGGIKMFRIARAAQRAPRASAPTDLSARTFVIAYNGDAGNRFRPRRCHPLFLRIPFDIHAVRARPGVLWACRLRRVSGARRRRSAAALGGIGPGLGSVIGPVARSRLYPTR